MCFSEVQKQLKLFSDKPNPNLELLRSTILKHVQSAGDDDSFRILVFVRTRATCQALSNWLNSEDVEPELRHLKAEYFTGTGAKGAQGGLFILYFFFSFFFLLLWSVYVYMYKKAML
jgi:ERCC4-related helicase